MGSSSLVDLLEIIVLGATGLLVLISLLISLLAFIGKSLLGI